MTTIIELRQQVIEEQRKAIEMRDQVALAALENATVEQMMFLRAAQKAIDSYDDILDGIDRLDGIA